MRRRNKKDVQFTKIIISAIIIVALIDMQLPFILSACGCDPVAELGKVIVVEIIGVTLVYCCKSFFETKEQKKNELEETKIRLGDITGFDDAEIIDLEGVEYESRTNRCDN